MPSQKLVFPTFERVFFLSFSCELIFILLKVMFNLVALLEVSKIKIE